MVLNSTSAVMTELQLLRDQFANASGKVEDFETEFTAAQSAGLPASIGEALARVGLPSADASGAADALESDLTALVREMALIQLHINAARARAKDFQDLLDTSVKNARAREREGVFRI